MSHRACGEVYECDLPPNEKFVLVSMADHADHNFKNIRPSIQLIAAKTNYSERQVQRYIKDFEKRGILVREKEGYGRGNTAVFRLNLSGVPKLSYFVQKHAEIDDEERVTSQVPCQPERVTSGDVKGDISSPVPTVKGDVPCHPNSNQVTRTVTEQGNPAVAGEGVSGDGSEGVSSTVSDHKKFTTSWCELFEAKFGRKYFFQPADGVAASRLLKAGFLPADILAVAVNAWDKLPSGFLREQSMRLAAFVSRYNEIQVAFQSKATTKPTWMEIRDLESEVKPMRQELEEWNALLQHDCNRTQENIDKRKAVRERVEAIDARLAELRK